LFLKKHRERSTSRVLGVNLFDFNLAIGKIVVEDIELVSTIIGLILPEDVEREYLAIIVQKRLKSFVRTASFKLNFNVFFYLSLIRRCLLHIDHSTGMSKVILRVRFSSTKSYSLILVETSGEIITVDNTENSTVDVKILCQIEILPRVILGLISGKR